MKNNNEWTTNIGNSVKVGPIHHPFVHLDKRTQPPRQLCSQKFRCQGPDKIGRMSSINALLSGIFVLLYIQWVMVYPQRATWEWRTGTILMEGDGDGDRIGDLERTQKKEKGTTTAYTQMQGSAKINDQMVRQTDKPRKKHSEHPDKYKEAKKYLSICRRCVRR